MAVGVVCPSAWEGFLAFECKKAFEICTCMRELDTVKYQIPASQIWTSLQPDRLRMAELSHTWQEYMWLREKVFPAKNLYPTDCWRARFVGTSRSHSIFSESESRSFRVRKGVVPHFVQSLPVNQWSWLRKGWKNQGLLCSGHSCNKRWGFQPCARFEFTIQVEVGKVRITMVSNN